MATCRKLGLHCGITEKFWDHEGADLLCMKFKLNGISGEGVSLSEYVTVAWPLNGVSSLSCL